MRITSRMSYNNAMYGIENSLSRLYQVQEQLSTGKRVNRPSDDPFAAHQAISSRTRISFLEQYMDNARYTETWANNTDSTLSNVIGTLQDTRVLAVQAINDTLAPAQREAIADQVDQQRAALMQLSAEQVGGSFLFSGTKTSTVPFIDDPVNPGEVIYQGNEEAMVRNIAPGSSLSVNLNGIELFTGIGSGAKSVFKILSDMSQALRTGDKSGMHDALRDIDASLEQISAKRSEVGAKVNRLEKTALMLSSFIIDEVTELSNAEDLDISRGVMELSIRENAYQASLAAASRVIIPSLIDYLK